MVSAPPLNQASSWLLRVHGDDDKNTTTSTNDRVNRVQTVRWEQERERGVKTNPPQQQQQQQKQQQQQQHYQKREQVPKNNWAEYRQPCSASSSSSSSSLYSPSFCWDYGSVTQDETQHPDEETEQDTCHPDHPLCNNNNNSHQQQQQQQHPPPPPPPTNKKNYDNNDNDNNTSSSQTALLHKLSKAGSTTSTTSTGKRRKGRMANSPVWRAVKSWIIPPHKGGGGGARNNKRHPPPPPCRNGGDGWVGGATVHDNNNDKEDDLEAQQGQSLVVDTRPCGDDDDDDDEQLLPSSTDAAASSRSTGKTKRFWNKLSHQVMSGNVLLQNNDSDAATTTSTTTTALLPRDVDKNKEGITTTWNSQQERHVRVEQAKNRIKHGVQFTLQQCLLAMLVYIAVAVLAFSFVLDHWTIVDSVYWALVTFTTIGYGDVVPQGRVEKVFTVVYALSGIACLGIAIGVVGTHVVEAQERAVRTTREIAKTRVLTLFAATTTKVKQQDDGDDKIQEEQEQDLEQTMDEKLEKVVQDEAKQKTSPLWELIRTFSMVLIILAAFAYCVAPDPGIHSQDDHDNNNLIDALYFTIITACTVGFGDLAPKTQHGRLLSIFFIPLVVGAMGHFLSIVAAMIMESRRTSFQRKLESRELSLRDLEIMDDDGDGNVTRAEFLEFMLVSMGKVDQDFIHEMRQYFAKLDTNGTGKLSREDLITNARNKLRRWDKKLQLAAYKEQLLRRAKAGHDASSRSMRSGSVWGTRLSFFQPSATN